jgi:hypothetical protein
MVYTIWYIPIAAWYIPSKSGIYHGATFQMRPCQALPAPADLRVRVRVCCRALRLARPLLGLVLRARGRATGPGPGTGPQAGLARVTGTVTA